MKWVMVVRVDTDEQHLDQIRADLKARFGDEVRTKSTVAWLYDDERAPVVPFRVRPAAVFAGVQDRDRRSK